jgi:hypothetical protein
MSVKKVMNEVFGGTVLLNYYTTKPTTGLTKGELLLLFHGSRPILGMCSSSGAGTIKMVTLKNTTVGRLTN